MAKRTTGPMALSCMPLSIDISMLTEDAEDEIRQRYYLANLIDRQWVLDRLTGKNATKAAPRDISHVLRDERGWWIDTPGVGDDEVVPSEYPEESGESSPRYPSAVEGRKEVLEIAGRYQEEIDRLKAEADAAYEAAWEPYRQYADVDVYDALPQEMKDEIEAAGNVAFDKEVHPRHLQIEELEKKRTEEIWSVLRVENPVPVTLSQSPKLPVPPAQRERLDEQAHHVAGFISEDAWVGHIEKDISARVMVSDYSVKFDNLDIMWAASDQVRASAHHGHRINVPGLVFGYDRIVAHEIGHLFEGNNDYALDAAVAFLDRRTAGDELKPLSQLSGEGYENHEFSRPDDFFHPYVGKSYTDSRGKITDTEVIAMGIEHYLYEPAMLANKDPEHFDLIWDLLHGNLSPRKASKATITRSGKTARDISHVWRDEYGRWTDTPGIGDDVPLELPEELPKEQPARINGETSPLMPEMADGRRDASDMSFSDLQWEMTKIQSRDADAYMQNAVALRLLTEKVGAFIDEYPDQSLIPEEKKESIRAVMASLADHKNAMWRIENEWARQFHNKFDLLSKDPVGKDIRWDFEGLGIVQQGIVKEGLALFGKYVSKGAVTGRQVDLLFRQGGGYNSSFDDVAINVSYSAGPTSVLHELGHWLETDPDIASKSQGFLDRRVGSQAEIPMSKASKDAFIQYPDWMFTQPDHFRDPYMGIVYKDRNGVRQGTEILSVGLEMLHSRPWDLLADRQHFELVMGIIQPEREFVTVSKAAPALRKPPTARDIAHVWRDDHGRWIDTPGAGDDAVVPSEHPKEQLVEPGGPESTQPKEPQKPVTKTVKQYAEELASIDPAKEVLESAVYKNAGYAPHEKGIALALKNADFALLHAGPNRSYDKNAKMAEAAIEKYMQETVLVAPVARMIEEDDLVKTLEEGRFKTLFETGTSGGMYDPEIRLNSELHGMGVPKDFDGPRPIYGFLDVDGEGLKAYGNVKVVFKESVRDKSTFAVSDTLGGWVSRDEYYTAATPLSARRTKAAWDDNAYELAEAIRRKTKMPPNIPYFEVQVHGGVKTDDIESIRFVGIEDARAARNRAKIIDLAEEKGIPWEPSAKWSISDISAIKKHTKSKRLAAVYEKVRETAPPEPSAADNRNIWKV